jgi:hypothetical protein
MQAIVMPDGTVSLGIVRRIGKQEVANQTSTVDGDIHGQPDVRSGQRERLPEQSLSAGFEPGHSKGRLAGAVVLASAARASETDCLRSQQ